MLAARSAASGRGKGKWKGSEMIYDSEDKVTGYTVLDPYLGMSRAVTADEAAKYRHVETTKSVSLVVDVDDPLSALLFFGHLRRMIRGDINGVRAELEVELSNLSESDMAVLSEIESSAWCFQSIQVTGERHFYEVNPEQTGALGAAKEQAA